MLVEQIFSEFGQLIRNLPASLLNLPTFEDDENKGGEVEEGEGEDDENDKDDKDYKDDEDDEDGEDVEDDEDDEE